jgi:hypothetical protein
VLPEDICWFGGNLYEPHSLIKSRQLVNWGDLCAGAVGHIAAEILSNKKLSNTQRSRRTWALFDASSPR